MKRILFTLLCLGVLGTFAGCYVDPALYGPASVEIGVGAYVEEPYYWDYAPRRYYWDGYRRPPRGYRSYPHYYWGR